MNLIKLPMKYISSTEIWFLKRILYRRRTFKYNIYYIGTYLYDKYILFINIRDFKMELLRTLHF